MVDPNLTPAERRFSLWMFISAYMYAISGLFFLLAGMKIAPFVNVVSSRFFPSLAPYPLPADGTEGGFWLVLSLSMMAMITWISRAASIDLRGNSRLVPVLLLSKFCSTMFYLFFFISSGQLLHLVGCLTDGPLFLVTLVLWIPASRGGGHLSETEEEILAAVGDAILPRGGAFDAGYTDFRKECLSDARTMMSAQDPFARSAFRFMLKFIDISPVIFLGRLRTFRRLAPEQRTALMEKFENSPLSPVRNILVALKILVELPFFSRKETAEAVGYEPAEVMR